MYEKQIYKGRKSIDNEYVFILKGNSLQIIQYWLPMLVLVVLAGSGMSFWGIPIRLVSYGPNLGLTRGLLVLFLMGVVLFLMLIYWILERRSAQLIPWLVWLHMGISLLTILGLCGGFCAFRQVSWFGGSILEWGSSVVGFQHLTRPLFWFIVGQFVLIGHGLVLWMKP